MRFKLKISFCFLFRFFITDVGESRDIHIDLNSFDSDMNRYSLQMLVKSDYKENQEFYITATLLTDNFGLGIDQLRISDEISDPQDRDSDENQENNKYNVLFES